MASPELIYSESQRDRAERRPLYRELAERRNHGLYVLLMWLKKTNTVWLTMTEDDGSVDKTFPVPNEEALEAFYHPYAYGHALGALATRELVVYEGEDGA